MLEFITINPSCNRANDFNIKGLISSRWQVDFYQTNPDYLEDPENEDQYLVGTLHFTAYDLEKNTPQQAYTALCKQLKLLLQASFQDQEIQYKPFCNSVLENIDLESTDPFIGFKTDYSDVYCCNLKSALKFNELLTGKMSLFTIANIEDLQDIVYLYYSSVKWLFYPFTDQTNTPCFNNFEEFVKLIDHSIELRDYMPDSIY